MNKFKIFSKVFCFLIICFLIFHFTIWSLFTKYIFDIKGVVGDLGRMSYKIDSLYLRKNINTLEKKHINFEEWNNEVIDIITIGDSFSNGGARGKNAFYQDYLETDLNLRVLNIQNIEPANNYMETIYLLNNSKILDELKVKAIIIESTEVMLFDRFSKLDINNTIFEEKDRVKKSLKNTKYKMKDLDVSFINNLNYNALIYNILYNYDDNAFFSNCYISKLSKNLFSSSVQDDLLYYRKTITYNKSVNKNRIKILNDNFNKLAKILKKKNIDLYFMPAVDKHNLYENFIINNKNNKNTFFEQLRLLKKEYRLIDTKKILLKEVNKGVKDVFYSDDTHWSYKASRAIVKDFKNNYLLDK